MVLSQAKLAETLNALIDGDRVSVTETDVGIVIYQLEGSEAKAVHSKLQASGWTDLSVSDEGGDLRLEQISEDGIGLTVKGTRPPVPEGIQAVVTSAGFASLLERDPSASVVWVEGLATAIETRTVRYAPWWDDGPFEPAQPTPNPAKVVRTIGPNGPGTHLGRWLLREADADVAASAATPWRVRAASELLRAMAQEIEQDGRLLFRGPPSARFIVSQTEEVAASGFAATQLAARWVFENERELENRHGLIATEIGRMALRSGNAEDLASVLPHALEGAKIAYNFGLSQQSADTLKALEELRKSVSDDAAKLSETTRTLGAAIVGAVFGNIALIVARVSLPADNTFVGPAAIVLGLVLSLYVVTIIGIGCHYISTQDSLRHEWKNRVYRFLSDDDYQRLVGVPIKKAVNAFRWTAVAGGAMTALLLLAVYYIATAPVPVP